MASSAALFPRPGRTLPLLLGIPLLLGAGTLAAVEPQSWEPFTQADLEKGEPERVSVAPDGTMQLSPQLDVLWTAEEPYVFGLAADPKGNVFVATGPNAVVYRLAPGKKEAEEFFRAETGSNATAVAVDGEGTLYVGTAPEGKIYRVRPDGSWETFHEPETTYVWSLHAAPDGTVYAGTGEEGQILRIGPKGDGSVFYDSPELNVTVLVPDGRGNLLAGGDGNAMVYRIAPDGTAFVLYDSPLRQITSLAVGPDGSVYASAVSAPVRKVEDEKKTKGSEPSPAKEKAEVVRIDPAGGVEVLWSTEEDTVFALAWTEAHGLLAGTGKTGRVYRVDERGGRTLLAATQQTQVTQLLPRREGIWLTTSNLGRLAILRRDLASEGTYLSPALDARTTARWGNFAARVTDGSGKVLFYTRSGNTEKPDKTWSEWRPVSGSPLAVQSPAARGLQWKAEFRRTGARGPQVRNVAVTWLPQNLRPRVLSIDVSRQGYVFDKEMAVRAMQDPTFRESVNTEDPGTGSRKLFRLRGWQTISWRASDPNEDRLVCRVFIRPEGEEDWIALSRDLVRTGVYSWDSTSLPDGRYTVRVEASDEEVNTAAAALRGDRESAPFRVDHTPPRVTSLRAERSGGGVRIEAAAEDSGGAVDRAEYSIDGGPWIGVEPADGIADSGRESYSFTVIPAEGSHGIVFRVYDDQENPGSGRIALPR